MPDASSGAYVFAGVDADEEEAGLSRLTARLRGTWPPAGAFGAVQLPFGQFANVIDIGGRGLAISTDGVGTKVLIAQMMGKYDTIGIDCVAMNVNDLLCVGAKPISLVDYIAVQEARPDLIDELSKGLEAGARAAGVSIVGGEIAQMRDVIAGDRPGYAFDLAATAVGTVDLDKIIVGRNLRPGDVMVGVASSGVHSNGLTLARQVFFMDQQYGLDWRVPGTDSPLGEELLRPTEIYVPEIVDLLEREVPISALAHITSEGFLNLPRFEAPVGFDVAEWPEVPPIFRAIQEAGDVPDEDMFFVYNMGVGFCMICPPSSVNQVMDVLAAHGRGAQPIGHIIEDPEKRVYLRPFHLVGPGKKFSRA